MRRRLHVAWRERVTAMLWQAEDCLPSMQDVARAFNIGERTLARNLQREGISFRNLAMEVRLQRSRQLLAEGGLSVTAVALTVGYTDIANFSRWFRRACGLSPSVFRNTQGRAA